ncbi:MAG: SDR family NAD(P)-dependent oxidoreductase [Alphaproteobacteria bacterium]|nr:SDR family NAD(P)-dependent oxidoreductase [Alphaproteobacteria bacterium]
MTTDKVAMISGANRGIGLAIARELARRGYRLSLGVRRPGNVPADLAALGDARCFRHRYDAAEPKAGDDWVAATLARFGRLDVLVNNAGISRNVELETGSDADLDELLDINVKAPFRLLRAAFPALKAGGSGRVVNVASMSGKRVLGLNAGYQMAKHAVVALNHAVRRAGWDHGIRSMALCPGFVNTDMVSGRNELDMRKVTQPADLATLACTVIDLPNTAAVAELLVNWRHEPLF